MPKLFSRTKYLLLGVFLLLGLAAVSAQTPPAQPAKVNQPNAQGQASPQNARKDATSQSNYSAQTATQLARNASGDATTSATDATKAAVVRKQTLPSYRNDASSQSVWHNVPILYELPYSFICCIDGYKYDQ